MRILATALALLILLKASTPGAQAQPLPMQLSIVVVEGEGAINQYRQRVGREPVIRVEDENHKPLAGAVVIFSLPTDGATGEFGNGSKNLTVMTDAQGVATAAGLRVYPIPGKLPIHVTASYRGLSATATVTQFTVVPPGVQVSKGGHGVSAKVIAILAVAGAAAGGGAYFATHKSSSSTPSAPAATGIGITPGVGTIGPPH